MKRWVCAISGFLIAFLTLGFQVVEAKTIYIGVSNPDMSFLSGGVAHFQGYFKDEGLDVEVLQMNANVSVAALAARNIDYNLILQSVVTANLRGLPLKVTGILIETTLWWFTRASRSLRISKARRSRLARSAPWSIFSPD
jgi:ABC-type nitrate/sulfonate/bicarbonate transport system substrate-binding protein